MTNTVAVVCLVLGGFLLGLFLVVAAIGALGAGHTMDNMWDMMGGMGDMHGMMGGGGPDTAGSATGEGDVRIVDFSYQPTTFTVTPGTIVTWTNEDSAPHTATGDDFDTGRLNRGDSKSVTFETPGEFDYKCEYHPSMEGRIVVSRNNEPDSDTGG